MEFASLMVIDFLLSEKGQRSGNKSENYALYINYIRQFSIPFQNNLIRGILGTFPTDEATL